MPLEHLPGVDLHYLQMGEQPLAGEVVEDVVLVHGMAANLGFWYLRIAPRLAQRFRVTIYDLRGHGLSSTPARGYTPRDMAGDLRELMARIGIESAWILGHSFGGQVAIELASMSPERVRGLILADVRQRSLQPDAASPGRSNFPQVRDRIRQTGLELDEGIMEFGMQLFEKMAKLRLERPEAFEKLQAVLPSPFSGRAGRRAAMRWLRLLDTTTAREEMGNAEGTPVERLRRVRKPALLVYGERSQVLASGQALKSLWPHARLEIVPGAGHFFPSTMPERLLEPVEKFIASQSMVRLSEAIV